MERRAVLNSADFELSFRLNSARMAGSQHHGDGDEHCHHHHQQRYRGQRPGEFVAADRRVSPDGM